jgi:uncharacterized protein YpmB
MKKKVTIIFFGLLLLVGAGYLYVQASAPFKNAEQEAFRLAKQLANITNPETFYWYHGTSSYYVVIGLRENGKKYVVWINKETKQTTVLRWDQGISEQEAIQKLKADKSPKKILHAHLGMERTIPLWEIAYINEHDQLNYYYIRFDTGEWWRTIEKL